MTSTEAAKRATAKYQREKMEAISIRVKRDEHLYDRIKQAAEIRGIRPAAYIKQALLRSLDADGVKEDTTITPDD